MISTAIFWYLDTLTLFMCERKQILKFLKSYMTFPPHEGRVYYSINNEFIPSDETQLSGAI